MELLVDCMGLFDRLFYDDLRKTSKHNYRESSNTSLNANFHDDRCVFRLVASLVLQAESNVLPYPLCNRCSFTKNSCRDRRHGMPSRKEETFWG
jgi:hypothetical protein